MVVEVFLILFGLLVCIILGANNASVCFGANVGAGFVKYSVAAGIAAVGVILGVILEGTKLSKAISGGVLTSQITPKTVLVIIITVLIVITIATVIRLPLSLSEGIIGSAVGIGLGTAAGVNWVFTSTLFIFWVINPLFSLTLSIIINKIVTHITYAVKNLLTLKYLYGISALTISFYVSYVLGANTVGTMSGIYNTVIKDTYVVTIAFGLATAFGMCFLSREITELVGKGIVGLSLSSALVAQLSSALTIHFFTQFGLPLSVTQASIGGIFGIGFSKRIALMNKRRIRDIVLGWIFSPIIAAIISFLLMKMT